MNSPVKDAIGVLKLVGLHIEHPTVVSQRTLRAASDEAIARLEATTTAQADELGRLYCALLSATPRGHVPYVTLTTSPATPYGCVITNADGNVVDRQVGKTIEGLVAMIAARQAPRAEAAQ